MRPLLSAAVLRSQSDERLVALARQGHEQAFAAIIHRYRRELHAHARRVAPVDRSDDIVQLATISAWSALGRQTHVQDLRPWLHRIVHNAALRVAMRADEHDELPEGLAEDRLTDVAVEQRFAAHEALVAVAALPERQRRAFEMTALGGVSGSDAAAALGVSEGTLRQLVHRARTALRSGCAVFVPGPLVSWAAASGGGDTIAGRFAELGAGAGLAATAGKVCAAVAVTASLVGGTTQLLHGGGSHRASRAHLGAVLPGVRHDTLAGAPRTVSSAPAAAVAVAAGPRLQAAAPAAAVQAVGSTTPPRSAPALSPAAPRPSGSASGSPGRERSGASGGGGRRSTGGDRSAGGGDSVRPGQAPVGEISSSEGDHSGASTLTPTSTSGGTASAEDNRTPAPTSPAPTTAVTTTTTPAPQPGGE